MNETVLCLAKQYLYKGDVSAGRSDQSVCCMYSYLMPSIGCVVAKNAFWLKWTHFSSSFPIK